MAFTDDQKSDIRWYMGHTDRFHQFDSDLEQAMEAITAASQALIVAQLTKLDALNDTDLVDVKSRLKAMGVGTIVLDGFREITALRSLGRQWTNQISATLGVSIRVDVWSPAGRLGGRIQG